MRNPALPLAAAGLIAVAGCGGGAVNVGSQSAAPTSPQASVAPVERSPPGLVGPLQPSFSSATSPHRITPRRQAAIAGCCRGVQYWRGSAAPACVFARLDLGARSETSPGAVLG